MVADIRVAAVPQAAGKQEELCTIININIMKKKRFDKRYLPMLWIGLALWLGSMLASYIMDKMGYAPAGQETLMEYGKALFQMSPFFTLMLLCFFQPILEEVSFRLWGVGKRWMTIVCLVLMTVFTVSEMHLWGLLVVGAVLAVWLLVRDLYIQRWINAVLTSVGFALCHMSGFNGFSLGSALGLVDIFGMALVLSWLTINVNFWLSALVHVANNSLAIILPLMMVGDPVAYEANGISMEMVPQKAFTDIESLDMESPELSLLDSATTQFYMVGEPAEIAAKLASLGTQDDAQYDWVPEGQSLEERVMLKVKFDTPRKPDFSQLFHQYVDMVCGPMEKSCHIATDTVMLKEVWLKYADGHEELMSMDCKDMGMAWTRLCSNSLGIRGNSIIQEFEMAEDSTLVNKFYCLERSNPILDMLHGYDAALDDMLGFKIELRDAKPVQLTTIKITDK